MKKHLFSLAMLVVTTVTLGSLFKFRKFLSLLSFVHKSV